MEWNNFFTGTVFTLSLLLLLYTLNCIRKYFQKISIIKKIPGPKPHLIFGNIPDLLDGNDNIFLKLRKWARDYYPAYSILSYPFVAVNIIGPEDIENLTATMKHTKKSLFYNFLHLWLGEGLLTSFGSKWQQRRKLLTPTFHFSILLQFIEIFNKETKKLVIDLEKKMNQGQFDVVPCITQFTLCSINETSMGTMLNFSNKIDAEYKNALVDFGKSMFHRVSHPWLYFKFPYYITLAGLQEKQIVKVLHHFTNSVIDKKINENINVTTETNSYSKRKRLAMLDLLMNVKNEGLIDLEGIRDEINTFMFEGHDTTAMALCFSLMLLANHPNIQEQIVTELNETIGKDQEPTYQNLNDLKFLERCIKECLRLYPSVPIISRNLEEDFELSTGKLVPKGTVMAVYIYDLHRNPNLYPDPEKFNPDRFLPENIQNRHPFAYIPFSAGPRNCIGQKFAMLEMKAALCGILRNFILEPIDTPDTIKIALDLVLRPRNGIKIKFSKRM